jgi:hypothetical protein
LTPIRGLTVGIRVWVGDAAAEDDADEPDAVANAAKLRFQPPLS